MPDKATTTAALSASAGTVVLGLTHEQWSVIAIIIGIAVTIATFALNAWYKHRLLRLAEANALGIASKELQNGH